jgi:hypothetical protein
MPNNLLNITYSDLLLEAEFLARRYPIDSPERAESRLRELLSSNNYHGFDANIRAVVREARAKRYGEVLT